MSNHTPGPWKIWNVAAPFQWMQWTDKMRAALAAHKAQQQEPMTWEQAVRHCITDKATQDRILSIPMDATAEEAIAILQAQQQEPWPIRGVRVEGDTVVVSVKGGNEAARWLCGAIIAAHIPQKDKPHDTRT
jgi:hypothetical protein